MTEIFHNTNWVGVCMMIIFIGMALECGFIVCMAITDDEESKRLFNWIINIDILIIVIATIFLTILRL